MSPKLDNLGFEEKQVNTGEITTNSPIPASLWMFLNSIEN